MSGKVFLCSLDGATWDVLDPLLRGGDLPVLASLIDDGVRGDLASTVPPSSPTAWTSFLTGVDSDTHGILDFTHLDEDREMVQQTAFETEYPTIWDLLSAHSYRIHSLNVPMTYPARVVDGSVVSGLPAPAISETSCAPSELADRIENEYAPYHVTPDHFQELSEYSLPEYVEYITESVSSKFDLAEAQLSDGDWDAAMLHLHETDIIQHCLWQHIDDAHPAYDHEAAERVKDVYRAIDTRLGSLLETLPEDTTVVVLSDHGFRRNETEIFINEWLRRKGYLALPTSSSIQATAYSFLKNHVSSRLATRIRDIVTDSSEESAESSLPSVYTEVFRNDETAAFSYGRRSAKLYLNDPSVVDQLVPELEEMRINGTPVVEEVHRFDGEEGPSLIVEPAAPFSFESSLTSDSLTKTVDPETDSHNGTHSPTGILTVKGPDIKRGGSVEGASIVDMLPTILYALDEPIPNHLDGKLLRTVFTETALESRSPRYSDVEMNSRPTLEKENDGDVRNRLEDLGYL